MESVPYLGNVWPWEGGGRRRVCNRSQISPHVFRTGSLVSNSEMIPFLQNCRTKLWKLKNETFPYFSALIHRVLKVINKICITRHNLQFKSQNYHHARGGLGSSLFLNFTSNTPSWAGFCKTPPNMRGTTWSAINKNQFTLKKLN